jgi:hypothetical protein
LLYGNPGNLTNSLNWSKLNFMIKNLSRLQKLLLTTAIYILAISPAMLHPSQSLGAAGELQSAGYLSQIDQDLTIRRIGVMPVVDNVDGIYARAIESQLVTLSKASHRWDYVEMPIGGELPSYSDLEEHPDDFKRFVAEIDADAFLATSVSRGPSGLSINLDLFLKKDGKLLLQEALRDYPRFELSDIRNQISQMYKRILSRIPYSGLILSRTQNRVTINLGHLDGIEKDQVLTAVQIVSINRHPKFNFLVSTDKEILGQIKILKVDETLSFGSIISEKESGAILKLAKVAGVGSVTYSNADTLDGHETGSNDLLARPDANTSFGKEPKEWLPTHTPSFGQIGLKLGLGTYNSSVSLHSAGALGANSGFYPSLGVSGELWLNPEWTIRAEGAQGVLSTPNPRSGSAPSTLNHSLSRYTLTVGYNFLLHDDFFGPKFQLSTGLMTYKMFVDDSQPTSLTSVNYTGYILGMGGSFPVTENRIWYVGGTFNLILSPRLSELPVTSGSSPKNSVNDFSLYIEKKLGINLRACASVDFSLYSTSFGGSTSTRSDHDYATSLSQKHSIVSGGINYLF